MTEWFNEDADEDEDDDDDEDARRSVRGGGGGGEGHPSERAESVCFSRSWRLPRQPVSLLAGGWVETST